MSVPKVADGRRLRAESNIPATKSGAPGGAPGEPPTRASASASASC